MLNFRPAGAAPCLQAFHGRPLGPLPHCTAILWPISGCRKVLCSVHGEVVVQGNQCGIGSGQDGLSGPGVALSPCRLNTMPCLSPRPISKAPSTHGDGAHLGCFTRGSWYPNTPLQSSERFHNQQFSNCYSTICPCHQHSPGELLDAKLLLPKHFPPATQLS